MSQLDKDAAKRAAAGESLGAFITFDINRLDKQELIMLGQLEMCKKYLAALSKGIGVALQRGNPDLIDSLRHLEFEIKKDADLIMAELGRSALRHKSATLQEIPKEPT